MRESSMLNPDAIRITRCCYGPFARQWIRWIERNVTVRKIDSIVAYGGFPQRCCLSWNLYDRSKARFKNRPMNLGRFSKYSVEIYDIRNLFALHTVEVFYATCFNFLKCIQIYIHVMTNVSCSHYIIRPWKNIDRESLLFYIHKFPWRTATANIRLNPAISRAITLANVEYFISTN